MMVTFISQCEKRALSRTRRVLDAFADRIGDNTWQTVITEDGLQTVKRMLRQTASKSTAVSCHWIRSRSRSQLLWVVGKRDKFNAQGIVAVNRTRRNLLQSELESDWHDLPLIKSLTAIAALLHDWGKATELFQEKLQPTSRNKFKGDPIRHEWISVLLLKALVGEGDDAAWLTALTNGDIHESSLKSQIQLAAQRPLDSLPPTAQLVAWLIVSHHRLPLPPVPDSFRMEKAESLSQLLKRIEQNWGYENRHDEAEYQKRLAKCFRFPNGLLTNSNSWLSQIKRWSNRLLDCQERVQMCIENGSYRSALSHARLCLMLGDHFYSSQNASKYWPDTTGLFANTDRNTNDLKQKLDEHLVGVARHALQTAHLLPAFEKEPPVAQDVQSLRKPSPLAYQWQDKAVKQIQQWRAQDQQNKKVRGFFAVNMASTGCGKTFANAKVMRALSCDQKSVRFILALGLRSLTLQTGREYRQRVGLDSSELAVQIGSRAVMELDQRSSEKLEHKSPEAQGSESTQSLLSSDVDYDCAIPEEGLATVLTQPRDRAFLYAPVLACTIDHMMAATETKRGGRYILPTLRLMSSDLVIDEIDDFTGNDLIAIGRLVHLAGMLGRKVMISSATIPPYMAEGFFNTYRAGWELYCQSRDAQSIVGCAWIDEFSTQIANVASQKLSTAIPEYRQQHKTFIEKRIVKLKQQPAKRKADLVVCQHIIDAHKTQRQHDADVISTKQIAYFNAMYEQALKMHQSHYLKDELTGLKVSFGVIRVANISPCVALTGYLLERDYPVNIQVRVMAYHSQQVMLLRSEQECHLDEVLKRKEKSGEAPAAFSNTVVRSHLNHIQQRHSDAENVLFILVATPVEEVGRDHDFDWAVVEPSSYRSMIQLAGRVKRHRDGEVASPNIGIMQYNWKGIRFAQDDDKKVFEKPGFEGPILLQTKNVGELIDIESIANRLDAIPRIQQPTQIKANAIYEGKYADTLADLEHMATGRWLAQYKATGPSTVQGWLSNSWWLSALSQRLTPFRGHDNSLRVYLVCGRGGAQNRFCEKDEDGSPIDREGVLNIERTSLSPVAQSRLWLRRDFDKSCQALAEEKQISPYIASLRYGELSFRFDEKKQYHYNDQLGLVIKK
jgi:CRISPR-associated endonuclease/helicase Cas3